MTLRIALVILMILTFATTLVGQDPIGRAPAPVPPEVQSRLEQQRRHHEKLRKPDFLRMEIAPAPDGDAPVGKRPSYKAGEKILVQVILINNSPEAVHVPSVDPYYQNRPQLVRGAQTVAYREDVAELIEAKEKKPTFLRVDAWELEPLKPQAVATLDLSDWYGPLAPGVYRLTLQHRLVGGGDWIDSAPLVLVVE